MITLSFKQKIAQNLCRKPQRLCSGVYRNKYREKYFRKQRGITQGELAELTGIHPVSIRKYETNKMQPLPPQVEKIAAALNVNFSAIYGMDQSAFRLETRGDLMGLLMTAYKAGLIQVDGPKDRYGAFKEEQCCIRLLPVLSQYFAVAGQEDENRNMLPALKVTDSSVLSDFIRWEGLYREGYLKDQELLTKGNSSEDEKYVADDFREMLEQIELDLQASQKKLDKTCDHGDDADSETE